jgi:RNA polymerase sigma-70 factor (ECF subfamily)
MAQRLVRAKRKIAAARILPVPGDAEVPIASPACSPSSLVFNEGYAASAAIAGARRAVRRGIRLGRLLTQLMPDDAETAGLLALMLIHDARRDARSGDGRYVALPDQDRARWNGGAGRGRPSSIAPAPAPHRSVPAAGGDRLAALRDRSRLAADRGALPAARVRRPRP